jgi:hypothetical protein
MFAFIRLVGNRHCSGTNRRILKARVGASFAEDRAIDQRRGITRLGEGCLSARSFLSGFATDAHASGERATFPHLFPALWRAAADRFSTKAHPQLFSLSHKREGPHRAPYGALSPQSALYSCSRNKISACTKPCFLRCAQHNQKPQKQ